MAVLLGRRKERTNSDGFHSLPLSMLRIPSWRERSSFVLLGEVEESTCIVMSVSESGSTCKQSCSTLFR